MTVSTFVTYYRLFSQGLQQEWATLGRLRGSIVFPLVLSMGCTLTAKIWWQMWTSSLQMLLPKYGDVIFQEELLDIKERGLGIHMVGGPY